MTKFSVLIPTRDRLEYLQQAVASILGQGQDDLEICISDNASSDGTQDWVAEIGDPRVRYSRSESLLPVTANWNRSLEMSSGDYVVMLGDDDALLRGYFSIHQAVIDEFGAPDAVYSKGLLYSYPGVIPGRPAGSLQPCGVASFLAATARAELMTTTERRIAVRDAFEFRMSYPFNMQLVLVSRDLISRLGPEPFFRSPYPDYFAMNRLMVQARSVVKLPLPTVVVGATRKSFGYFYFTGDVSSGVEFLQNRSALVQSSRTAGLATVPGSEHLDSWLLALEALGDACPDLTESPDLRRYRRMRFGNVLRQLPRDAVARGPDPAVWEGYPWGERRLYASASAAAVLALRICPPPLRRQARRVVAKVGSELACEVTWRVQPELMSGFETMNEVVATITPERFGAAVSAPAGLRTRRP